MRVVREASRFAVVFILLAVGSARAERAASPAAAGEPARIAALERTEIYSDPYRRYFSGHWCNCWRNANLFPIDEQAIFAGILPRTDTPVWMKPKMIEMDGMEADEKLLCRVFAGLVNRRKGMWYCKDPDDFWMAGRRAFYKNGIDGAPIRGIWKDNESGGQGIGYTVQKTGGTSYLVGVKRFVVELDPPSIDGCIIYDPALLDLSAKPKQPRDLLNVIRTICAIERAVPLTPRLYEGLMKEMGADAAKLPVLLDTTKRTDWDIEKFHGDEKAAAYSLYAWAFNNFWNNPKNADRQCVHHVLAFMPPVSPTDPEHDMTDYVVQWKIFSFYSDGGGKLDEKHMEYILGQTPMNIAVIGQLTALDGAEGEAARTRLLRLFSRFGKYFVDAQNADNLSMHSGEREKERFAYRQKPAGSVALDPAKSYVAFCLTGFNSIGHYMSARANHWDFASRGSVPVGWGIPLAAADVLPNITKYYYAQATPNDCFVADIGGLGVALPTVWGAAANQPDKLLADYFARSKEYLGYLDLTTIWADGLDPDRVASLTRNPGGLRGVFYGTMGASRYLDRAGFVAENVPVIHTYVDVIRDAKALEQLPAALQSAKERFLFIGVDETAFGPNEDVVGAVAKAAKQLGDRFVMVRPDQLTSLYADAVKAGQAPAEPPRSLGQSAPDLTLKRLADGTITVDGKEEDWKKAAALRAYVTRAGKTVAQKPPDSDLAAEVAAAVDSRFLYVIARVRDAQVIADDVNPEGGDHVELHLDLRREPFREPAPTEGFYRLALVPAVGLVKKPQLVLQYPPYDVGLASMNKHGIEESLSSVVADGGYVIEAAIPLVNFPGRQWKAGDRVAIGFGVHNLDAQAGAAAGAARPVAASVDPLACQPAVVD